MNAGKLFPVALESSFIREFQPDRVMVQTTGEKRPPRKGEWYVSGAIPEGYKAPNDLSQPHVIAKLVQVEKQTRILVVGEIPSNEEYEHRSSYRIFSNQRNELRRK